MAWLKARVADVMVETPTARTLVLEVPGWPGHRAGQHLDVRLTAEDGYTARRSYSIASAPERERVDLTVDRLDDGEVSPYLTDDLRADDLLEVRGPIGGYFVWPIAAADTTPDGPPTQLFAGGSGIVPLMAIIRERARHDGPPPMHLVYSVRTPEQVIYADELAERAEQESLRLDIVYTRHAPDGWTGATGRLTADVIERLTPTPGERPAFYVCGPTGFVEAVASALVELGHAPELIRTERFGPTGG
jgi:ferredoxin-NADP reductase